MHILSNHLYIVSTPIGNLDDITLRAIEVLKKSDIILCEDTRRSIKLLSHYNIKKKLVSYHKFNEKKQLANIIKYFNEGKILSLISDAGTPLLSDPGRLLVNKCIENSVKVTPIPGVSSITSALSVSGFSDKFLFYGFLPKTENELDKVLSHLSKSEFTQIFFIPSKKLYFYIKAFKKFYLERKIMIAKEITKIHEAFIRDQIDELKIFKNSMKGELTVVISENNTRIKKFDEVKIVNKIKKFLKTYSLKDTVNLITETEDINKKKVYSLCLKIRNEKNY
ncbi:MAG: 16S rRNA (cytidine(1402)-2'-O)-methyltransferase [Candidatus Pelagibacter bacterium]|nr:16S rRNA (cytidine(1402)-2'-O)-methyltransferase [Candidatus Pelagibacter bacterium]MBL6861032.1 16S rRNA (cytidine(1402)-2'-O)-methyltransferase [Candidatus Pelagibacter bacterium]